MADSFLLDLVRDEGWRLPRMLLALAAAGGLAGVIRPLLSHLGLREKPATYPRHVFFTEVAILGLFVACCLVPLMSAWLDAGSDGGSLFGLLPWSDAREYYKGAADLLQSGKLDAWNLRRPLNASLLAVRLAISGGGLRGALLMQGALLGLSLYLLSRTVCRDLGWPGGLVVFVSSFVFARGFLHLFLSEILGLTFGALGLSLLWLASRRGDRRLLGFGACAMTLALQARAGPLLMLPALAFWAVMAWPGERRARAGAFGAVILGVVAATVFNAGVAGIHGGRLENSHGNFHFILYGLATGKPGWTKVYDDYPEVRAMHEVERNAFIREKAIARIRMHPDSLIAGLSAGWGAFRSRISEKLGGLEGNLPAGGRRWFYLPLLFGGLPLFLWRHGLRRETTMVFSLLGGTLASVPVVWVDGGSRVFAAAIPLLGMLPAYGLAGLRPARELFPEGGSAPHGPSPKGSVALLLVLMIAAAAGPTIARRFASVSPPGPLPPSSDPSLAVIRSDSPSIRLLPTSASKETFVPDIVMGHFLRNLPLPGNREFRRIPPEGAVLLARDWKPGPSFGRYLYVVGPGSIAEGIPRYVFVKGAYSVTAGVLNVSDWRDIEAAR